MLNKRTEKSVNSNIDKETKFEKENDHEDAKRILGVMGLGVKCGQEIILKTDGDQEEEAIAALGKFLEEKL